MSYPAFGEFEKGVALVGCGDGDSDSVLAVRAHDDAVVGGVRSEALGITGHRQPDEVGLRTRHVIFRGPQRRCDPGAFRDDGIGAGQQLLGGVQAGDCRGLGDAGDGEWNVDLGQRGDDVGMADGVPDPQTGQPVRL